MHGSSITSSRFRVVRCLGSGATGEVYEAIDRERGARVAIKTLRSMQPHAIARFKNEFRALQDIEHPNLMSLGELLEDDGQLFFTMELVRGMDFLSFVRPGFELAAYADTDVASGDHPDDAPPAGGALDMARLRHALTELGRGLLALHAAGKVHRDVKPSNVVVTDYGRVVLLDFGLLSDAQHDDSWTGQGIVGTPHYMAPEQAAGHAPGPAADWYAVGVMLYEALTGRPPYEGPIMKVLLDKQRHQPPAPVEVAPDAPAPLSELCMELLRFDPAERPPGRRVLRRLGRAGTEPRVHRLTSTLTQGPPFVGRTGELRVLGEALTACIERQRPIAVLVRGDSGVGKSTLLERYTSALGDEVTVLAGRCFERESVSYKAFDGVVEALARRLSRSRPVDAAALLPLHAALLAQVFPVLKRVRAFADAPHPPAEPPDQRVRVRVFAALRELFTRLVQRHPVVVAIDDLQWADDDSLALMTDLLRPPNAPPLLLLGTLRPTVDGRGANATERVRAVCPDVREIRLGPLDRLESRELACRLIEVHGVTDAVDVDTIASEAGGHPLFIDELVRHAADFGARGGEGLRLEDALWSRVCALEPGARQALELVCLAGNPIPLDTLTRAADAPPERLGRIVSVLRVHNFVRTTGGRGADTIEPYHDRVRHAVISRLTTEQRAHIHRTLAVALEGSHEPGLESMLALHWRGAGRVTLAARYAAAAAASAADALAFDRAARFYRTALDLGHEDRAVLLSRLGDALANAGRGAEAADAYLDAADTAPADSDSLDLRRLAAEQLLISGHIERGLRLIRQVLDALGMKLPSSPRGALASLVLRRALLRLRGLRFRERQEGAVAANDLTRVDMCWSVATGLAMVDNIRGSDFQTRHLLLALRAGEPTRLARALAVEGGFLSTTGPSGRRRGRRLFDAAAALLERTPSPHAHALLIGAECIAAYQGGQWRRTLELARETEQATYHQKTNAAWQIDTMHLFWMYSLFYLGELRELSVRAPALLRAANERGDLYGATNLRAGLCNAAWLVRDDVAAARRHLEAARRQWTRDGFHVQHYHQLLGLTNIHLYAGEPEAGYRAIDERWPDLRRSMLTRVEAVRIEAWDIRARLALAVASAHPRDAEPYLREARSLGRRLVGCGATWGVALGELVLAAVADARGRDDECTHRLRAAAAGFERADMAIYLAVVRWHLGQRLGAEGRLLVESARAVFEGQAVADPTRFMGMIAPGLDH